MVIEREFLEAFKEVFVYQARKKFGRSDDVSALGRYLRPLVIPVYIVLLYVFTQNHYVLPLFILTFVGCTWLSAIAMDSIRMIYHRRRSLADDRKRFREVDEFTFRERLFTYMIPALVLTGIFAGSMFVITFARTGEVNLYVFVGVMSIPLVMVYYLRNDYKGTQKRSV